MHMPMRLGVNIDHVATLRNARGGKHPCPVAMAEVAISAGAHGITAHLREDRRHIRDDDIKRLRKLPAPLNMEMALTDEMVEIACDLKPHAVCIVPESREEITTEGGLNVVDNQENLQKFIPSLKKAGIRVSLFVDADEKQIAMAKTVGAEVIELHTGPWCLTKNNHELERLRLGVKTALTHGLECHAGHGLTYDTIPPLVKIGNIRELNIGHFIMGEAIKDGLPTVIQKILDLIHP